MREEKCINISKKLVKYKKEDYQYYEIENSRNSFVYRKERSTLVLRSERKTIQGSYKNIEFNPL